MGGFFVCCPVGSNNHTRQIQTAFTPIDKFQTVMYLFERLFRMCDTSASERQWNSETEGRNRVTALPYLIGLTVVKVETLKLQLTVTLHKLDTGSVHT
jgi:hypothetical protein